MLAVWQAVHRRLADDAPLRAVAVGGVHARPVKTGTGPHATPEAFAPGSNGLPRLRPCVVVLDGGEARAANAPEILDAKETYPRLFFFAPDTDAGVAAIDAMDARVRALLAAWTPVVDGRALAFTPTERTELLRADDVESAVFVFRRYRGEWLS